MRTSRRVCVVSIVGSSQVLHAALAFREQRALHIKSTFQHAQHFPACQALKVLVEYKVRFPQSNSAAVISAQNEVQTITATIHSLKDCISQDLDEDDPGVLEPFQKMLQFALEPLLLYVDPAADQPG